jgi:hypothetical protein
MGMTIDEVIHKLDFSISAYQKLINENVANGEVVGTGVRGTWTASTPLNKAYSDMIEALQISRGMIENYEQRLKSDLVAMLTEIQLEIEEKFNDRPFSYNHHQRTEFYRDIDEVIQQKINSLKEA